MDGSDGGSSAGEEEVYIVEKILKKRIVAGGKTEYFLKWEGYGDEDNTWEPADYQGCHDLIPAFEQKWEEEEETKRKAEEEARKTAGPGRQGSGSASPPPIDYSRYYQAKQIKYGGSPSREQRTRRVIGGGANAEVTGFGRGLRPERIIGATDSSGELMFLMKWKDSDVADFVPARQANVKCPQVVITFYEERIIWNTQSENEED